MKATKAKGSKASKPKAKPAKPRKAARQQDIPETREHEPDSDLDTLAHDAYDKTLTSLGAAQEMRTARAKLMEKLKDKLNGSEVDFYTTASGLRVTLVRSKEKIAMKMLDSTDSVTLDDSDG